VDRVNAALEGRRSAPPPPRPALSTERVEAEIPKLQRQIATLKDQLEAARRQVPAQIPPWKRAAPIGGAAGGALLLGLLAGAFLFHPPRPAEPIVILAPPKLEPAAPVYRYKPGDRPMPSANDLRDARQMLATAEEHLAQRDLDGAQRLLGVCIEIADLPDCHKTLGGLLALTRSAAARTHLERYLKLAPDAPDADAVRQALAR
jgi:hypothetical protein